MVAIRIPGPESIDQVPVGDRERTIVPHATAASFGGQLAEAQVRGARAVGDMGDTILKIGTRLREERQGFEDNTYNSTYSSEYSIRAAKEYQEAQKEYPEGGEGFTNSLNERLQRAQKETHENIQGRGITPSVKAKVQSDANATGTRTNYLVHGMTWENNQKVKSLEDQLDQNAQKAENQVFTDGDVDKGMATVDDAIAAQHGVIPADKLRLKHKMYTEAVQNAAVRRARAEGDIEGADALVRQFFGTVPGEQGRVPGMLEPGNIDMKTRPVVKNADGTISTVKSTSVNIDGKEVLIPTIADDGRQMTTEEAIAQYQETGKHLGMFDTPENATAFAKRLSEGQGVARTRAGGPPDVGVSARNPHGLEPWIVRTFEIESGAAYRSGGAADRTGSNYGLGQFSPDLERKYGITPADRNNPIKQAEAVRQERAEFEKMLGRPMEDWEFYLAHQQGFAGSRALLEHPEMPAWQALRQYASGEYNDAAARRKGFANGDEYAKAAVRGNIPAGNPLKAQPVDTVSSQQFAGMWEYKWGGGPSNPNVGNAVKWDNAIRSTETKDRTVMKKSIEADLVGIQTLGKPNLLLSHDSVRKVLGPAVADEWLEQRNDAQRFWDVTQDFYALPNSQMYARINTPVSEGGLRPDENTPRLPAQLKMYNDAVKKADAIRKARNEDPAASVSNDPEVRQASMGNNGQPWDTEATTNALITARLAAQERAGIHPNARSPITQEEGVKLVAPLMHPRFGNEREIMEETIRRFEKIFGNELENGTPRSVNALVFALDAANADQEFTKQVGAVVRSLGLNTRPTRADARAADQSRETAAARNAVEAPLTADPKKWQESQSDMGAAGTPAFGGRQITSYDETGFVSGIPVDLLKIAPAKAINYLLSNKSTAPEFERWYGKGTADTIFKTFPTFHSKPPPVPDVPPVPTAVYGGGSALDYLLGRTAAPAEPTRPTTPAASERTAPRATARSGEALGGVRMGGRTYKVGRDANGQVSTLSED